MPRSCALMTPRVAVPAVWLRARLRGCAPGVVVPAVWRHSMCELRCASYARSRSLHLHGPHVRAPIPSLKVVRAAGETPPKRTSSASSATRLRHECSCLAQLHVEGGVELLDNDGNTVSFNTRLLRHFVKFHGRTYNCHPDAVDLDRSLRLVLGLRPRWSAHTEACAHSRSAPPLRAVGGVLLLGRPRG